MTSSSSNSLPNKNMNMMSSHASTNPFDDRIEENHRGKSASRQNVLSGGGNPFDAASPSQSQSFSPSSPLSPSLSISRSISPTTAGTASTTTFSSMNKETYSVVYGTDRGTLHYRAYPSSSSSSTIKNRKTPIAPIGLDNINNSSGGGAIHPIHQAMDVIPPTNSFPIVSCIRAHSTSSNAGASAGANSISSRQQHQSQNHNHNPIFLILQDDKANFNHVSSRSSMETYAAGAGATNTIGAASNAAASATSKTFVAHLITLNHFSSSSVSGLSGYSGYSEMSASSSSSSSSTLICELPRMSSVTYHPLTGYVYSSGSSIYSLPPGAVFAISSFFGGSSSIASADAGVGHGGSTNAGNSSFSSVGASAPSASVSVPLTNTTTALTSTSTSTPTFLPKIYYHGENILPSCGVRSDNGGLSVICGGRIVVAAMKNGSFYAVSGTSVSDQFWLRLREDERNGDDTAGAGAGAGAGTSAGTGSGGAAFNFDTNKSRASREMMKGDVEKILTFRQSSPVHPAISIEIPIYDGSNNQGKVEEVNNRNNDDDSEGNDEDDTSKVCTSLVFLASGRECAVVEIMYNSRLYSNNRHSRMNHFDPDDLEEDMQVTLLPSPSANSGSIVIGSPRHGIATLASPILAAVGLLPPTSSPSSLQAASSSSAPLVAILTSDGLVHTRSPSFISIPLSEIEVGNRPNDFFSLQALPNKKVVAGSYSGEARLISFREDTVSDLSDRMMQLSIDAFGSTGFPRAELAEAIGATFTATSYVGQEPTTGARNILKQYLETCLGLDMSGDFGGAALYKRFLYGDDGDDNGSTNALMSSFAASYLSATAMLCLVCTRLSTPNSPLANRAAKSCATKFGVVGNIQETGINAATAKVCELIAERLLIESESTRTLPPSGGLATGKNGIRLDMVEAASWLLRSCGQHERSIGILQERMNNPSVRNIAFVDETPETSGDSRNSRRVAGWSQVKYDSHICTHLGELWSSGDRECQEFVLNSSATRELLETNPTLGLKVFTSMLPQNEEQWLNLIGDPLLQTNTIPAKIIDLLKSIRPIVPINSQIKKIDITVGSIEVNNEFELPLESGRALAVVYLESAIGISTGRPPIKIPSTTAENNLVVDLHNELAFLLLEGVLSERSDDDAQLDSDLGKIYREKLRRLLGWHSSKVQPDQLMHTLPSSFLREKALLLGQLGRHEDALRIFYFDLKSLDLALEYCDARYEKQQAQNKYDSLKSFGGGVMSKGNEGCAYLPLVRVALESDQESERGITAAIQVLSLRRENIDRAAALRLLPKNVPVSALARSFLIPALIDSESQARRLTVTASLLRAKYVRLKKSLTEAQIKSQSILQNVPALQSLNLGDPVYASNSFKARPSNASTLHFPDVTITKHFFPRYVIIQATATAVDGMTLGNVQLVVAESSDEALLPSLNVPIKTLPPGITGSSWCVLAASPQRLDGIAILVTEMHYSILSADSTTTTLEFDNAFQSSTSGRSYVEEIQDIEIRRAEFEG